MEFNKKNTKIYILSGKAKSGKNLVSEIIEKYYKNKKCISISYSYYLKDYVKRITGWNGNEETKPREMLQQIGIELIKNKINDKLFINRVLEDISVFSYFYDVIIISDARLIEEIEIPKQKLNNVTTIRINRDIDNKLTEKQKSHITETALDNYTNFDYIIDNKDYETLEKEVLKILEVEYENSCD